MYDNENSNVNNSEDRNESVHAARPRFDAKTGERIYYPDEQTSVENTDHTTSQTEQNQQTEYRFSKNEIPFQNENDRANDNATQNQQFQNGGMNMHNNQFQQQYESPFQNTNYQNGAAYTAPQNGNRKKQKKKTGFAKKTATLLASAAVFGLVAGSVMYGVYYTGVTVFPTSANRNYEIATVGAGTTLSNVYSADSETTATGTMNVQAVAASVMPAMVALNGTTTVSSGSSSFYGLFGGTQSYEANTSGTGIIVGKNDTELLIVTNAHVVDDVNNLSCQFTDGESVSATVKGSKSDKDIAVVAVNLADIKDSTLGSIAIAELADSDNLAVGQDVVAIGNALGEGQSVTNGIISAMDRSITVNNVTFSGLLMTNAAINSGNSGGALLNAEGKVIAINFAKTSQDGVEGMAYSIPVSNVKDIIDTLMNRVTRNKVSASEAGFLGISGMDISSSVSQQYGYPQGILVRNVEENSAAAKAGLGVYDIIVSFDDQSVSSMSALKSLMQYYAAGETVKIEYYHPEGSEYVLKTMEVTLGKKN